MTVETLTENWNAYMAAYGALDEGERRRLLEQSTSEDVVFTNPAGDGKSRDGLFEHIGTFQKNMPGMYFTTSKLYPQVDKLLAIWAMHKKDGTQVATGYNFVRSDADGRFSYMAGFF